MDANTPLDKWAKTSLFVATKLLGDVPVSQIQFHPGVLMQQATQHLFAPGTLRERYSPDRPSHMPRSPDEELLIPIDQVLGEYDDRKRRITIYVHNIADVARRLQCNEDGLQYVVRLHEYAHALDHTGLPFDQAERRLSESVTQTNRRLSPRSRATRRYRSAEEEEKEFWAQSMSWLALQALPTPGELSSAYLELMRHQRPEYQLDWDLLTALTPCSLRELRKVWTARETPPPPPTTSARTALQCLLRKIGAEHLRCFHNLRNSIADLSTSISPSTFQKPASRELTVLEQLIARNGPIQVRIYAEATTHPLPHFHLYHKAGYAASYAIEDCRRLAGSMISKHEKVIYQWARNHRDALLQAWRDVNDGRAPERLVLVV